MKNDFLENGYCVIDNFLPNDIADDVEMLFKKETEWEKINQVRENHYKHVFKKSDYVLLLFNPEDIKRKGLSPFSKTDLLKLIKHKNEVLLSLTYISGNLVFALHIVHELV